MFPPPSQSYYCLLKVNSEDAEGEEKQYLVCFLSIGKEGLDLYPHHYTIGHWMVPLCTIFAIKLKFGAKVISLCFSKT